MKHKTELLIRLMVTNAQLSAIEGASHNELVEHINNINEVLENDLRDGSVDRERRGEVRCQSCNAKLRHLHPIRRTTRNTH